MLEQARKRRTTGPVKVGPLTIGDGAPVVVQSMTKTDTRDVGATVAQIEQTMAVGCELMRLAVPDEAAAEPGQYRFGGESPRGGAQSAGVRGADSHRRQRWLAGAAPAGEIRLSDGGGHGRKR